MIKLYPILPTGLGKVCTCNNFFVKHFVGSSKVHVAIQNKLPSVEHVESIDVVVSLLEFLMKDLFIISIKTHLNNYTRLKRYFFQRVAFNESTIEKKEVQRPS